MALGFFGVPTLWTQNQSQTPCDLNCLTEPALVDVARPCEQSHWRAAFQRAVCLLFLKIFLNEIWVKLGSLNPMALDIFGVPDFFRLFAPMPHGRMVPTIRQFSVRLTCLAAASTDM